MRSCATRRARRGGSVDDVIARRTAGIDRYAAEELLAVALSGHLDWATARDFAFVDDLLDADLIEADETGLRTASAAVAEAVIARASAPRRRAALTRLIAATDSRVQRARWTLRIGEQAEAADHHAAAAALLSSGDPGEAERHAAIAFDVDPRPEYATTWSHALLLGSLPAHDVAGGLARIAAAGPAPADTPPVEPFLATLVFSAMPIPRRRGSCWRMPPNTRSPRWRAP
ncbi:MAG: hypothetical protein QM703_02320 [Gemmatales bacterium]